MERRTSIKKIQLCPICKQTVSTNPRYPNHLCSHCVNNAVDSNGRSLVFYNSSMSGGFKAHFKDNNRLAQEVTKNHIVFVNGTKIWANEARFGGIVLQPIH